MILLRAGRGLVLSVPRPIDLPGEVACAYKLKAEAGESLESSLATQ